MSIISVRELYPSPATRAGRRSARVGGWWLGLLVLFFGLVPVQPGYAAAPFGLAASPALQTRSGWGLNGFVYATAVQTDHKIVVGGIFTAYNNGVSRNGTSRNRIARLEADGNLDTTFTPGLGANDPVTSVVLQTDGKILIGGGFTSYNGVIRHRVARLNPDGSLDTTFDPGAGFNGPVYAMALQGDGKIVIGGNFTRYNGAIRNRIARLNPDGSLDGGFHPGPANNYGATGDVMTVALQGDGKLVIGGWFTRYNLVSRNSIARTTPGGGLDGSFDPGTGADVQVNVVAVQADGKILVGGWFTRYNGTPVNRIARLNSDGTLDSSFAVGTGFNGPGGYGPVHAIALQGDGRILVGGGFTNYNGLTSNRIARLNSDGTLDSSFDPGTGANGGVRAIVVQGNGKIVIGGDFDNYNGARRDYLARLNANGTLDSSFDPGSGSIGGPVDATD